MKEAIIYQKATYHALIWKKKKKFKNFWETNSYKAISEAFWAPLNYSEIHYLQMEKAWSSSEPSQEWLANQTCSKSMERDRAMVTSMAEF